MGCLSANRVGTEGAQIGKWHLYNNQQFNPTGDTTTWGTAQPFFSDIRNDDEILCLERRPRTRVKV